MQKLYTCNWIIPATSFIFLLLLLFFFFRFCLIFLFLIQGKKNSIGMRKSLFLSWTRDRLLTVMFGHNQRFLCGIRLINWIDHENPLGSLHFAATSWGHNMGGYVWIVFLNINDLLGLGTSVDADFAMPSEDFGSSRSMLNGGVEVIGLWVILCVFTNFFLTFFFKFFYSLINSKYVVCVSMPVCGMHLVPREDKNLHLHLTPRKTLIIAKVLFPMGGLVKWS